MLIPLSILLICSMAAIVIGLSCTGGSCLGCTTCTIGSDTFSSNDLATAWTVVGGGFNISSGALNCTSAGFVIFNTVHPDGISSAVVTCDVEGISSGDQPRILVNYTNASNFNFLQFTVGSSPTLKLGKRVAGVETILSTDSITSYPQGAFYTVRVFFDGATSNTFVAQVLLGGYPVLSISATISGGSGTQVGLGCSSGTAKFQNFIFEKYYQASTAPACKQITPGPVDVRVMATIYQAAHASTTGVFIGNAFECYANWGGGNYIWENPGGPKGLGGSGTSGNIAVTPASGDVLQITLARSGASCVAPTGDFYSDTFSGAIDAGWLEAANPGSPATFANSAGQLIATAGSNIIRSTLYRQANIISGSSSYTLKVCINGTQVLSGSFLATLSTSADPFVRAGVVEELNQTLSVCGTWDSFFLDIDG